MRTIFARRWLLTVPVLAFGLALTACGAIPGVPSVGAASSSAEPPMDLHGAPHVAKPLDLAKYLKDPCSAIASDRLQQLDAKYPLGNKAAPDSAPTILAGCNYTLPNLDPNVGFGSVGFLTGGAGLSALYWNKQTGTFTSFEPLTIEGYPAVNSVAKGEGEQSCQIVVGATDRVAIQVQFSPADENTPRSQTCAVVQAMAMAVVQTLKANQ